MPFGLVSAPSTFERCIENVLRGLQWQTYLIYLDDIIIFSQTFEDHLENLTEVFKRIKNAGLKLKRSKCEFLKQKIKFLGHVVSEEGISTDPEKISAVADWPAPTRVTEIQSFLGFCFYYRKFTPRFSHIASPLSNLTRKDVKYKWTENCESAFNKLKDMLMTAPVMAYPTDKDEYILDTDASDLAIGGTLIQVQNGIEKTIAYGSRTLNKAERRYCVTRRELLAIVNFIQHYKHSTDLLGRKFKVRSDHHALKWIFRLKDPSGQVARWLETLSSYQFTVDYRPGTKHKNADGLSRIPWKDPLCECIQEDHSYLPCGPCKKCSRYNETMNLPVSRVITRRHDPTDPPIDSPWPIGYNKSQIRDYQIADEDISCGYPGIY